MRVTDRSRGRDERGATAAIVAVLMTALLSVGAFTIDYGAASLVRRQTQNAADATARAVVARCAKQAAAAGQTALSGTCIALSTDDRTIVQGNAPGSAAGAPSIDGSGRVVTLSVSERVDYTLAKLLGKSSATVTSTAKVEWTTLRPTEGYPVIPFGVSECTFNNSKPGPGSIDGPRTLIRSDTLQTVRNLVGSVSAALQAVAALLKGVAVPLDDLAGDLSNSEAACSNGNGPEALELKGGAWLTEAIDLDLSGATCDINTRIGIVLYASSTLQQTLTSRCANLFGTKVKKGQTVLLPVYTPKPVLTGVTGKLGLTADVCPSGVNGDCVRVPPSLGASIKGYAPFTVTGWRFGSVADTDPLAPVCNNVTITMNLASMVAHIAKGGLVSVVLGAIGVTLIEASLGCNGIQGYFTKSFTKDPSFKYETGGKDYGAGYVRLSN